MCTEVVRSRLDIEKSGNVAEKQRALRNSSLLASDSGGKSIYCQVATEGTCTELLSKYTKLKAVKSRVLG